MYVRLPFLKSLDQGSCIFNIEKRRPRCGDGKNHKLSDPSIKSRKLRERKKIDELVSALSGVSNGDGYGEGDGGSKVRGAFRRERIGSVAKNHSLKRSRSNRGGSLSFQSLSSQKICRREAAAIPKLKITKRCGKFKGNKTSTSSSNLQTRHRIRKKATEKNHESEDEQRIIDQPSFTHVLPMTRVAHSEDDKGTCVSKSISATRNIMNTTTKEANKCASEETNGDASSNSNKDSNDFEHTTDRTKGTVRRSPSPKTNEKTEGSAQNKLDASNSKTVIDVTKQLKSILKEVQPILLAASEDELDPLVMGSTTDINFFSP